jgi:hypothetical protein
LNNLIYILVSNSGDREINKIILSIFNKNQEIFKTIYQIEWQNFPFQNTNVYKKGFKDYLSYIKSQNNGEKLNDALYNFLRMEHIDAFSDSNKSKDIIDQFLDTDLFDDFLIIYLNNLMFKYDFLRVTRESAGILEIYSDNVLVKNLIKSMEGMKKFDDIRYSKETCTQIDIEHYSVTLSIFDMQILRLVFLSRSFDNIFHDSFSITDIPSYLNGLKSKFSKSDIEIIEERIYSILIAEKFAVTNITLNRSIINKIITRYGDKYMKEMIDREGLSLKYFDNEHIHPSVKLLAYHLMKEPLYPKLIEDSIVYFRESSSEEKKRAFSILYSVLNPFKLA